MRVAGNGKFSFVLSSKELAQGLRRTDSTPRNNPMMTSLSGMVGKDEVLQALDQLERIDTDIITDDFPYPQIFVLSNYILICSSTKIYDYSLGSLNLKLTTTADKTWKVIDFIEYLVLTNGSVMVIRDATTGDFSISSDLPASDAICNYNGQVLIGGLKEG